MGAGERGAERAGRPGRRRSLVDPLEREDVRQRGDDLRQRCAAVDSQPLEAGRLRLEKSVRPRARSRRCDPGGRLGPAFRKDRRAVVEGQPRCRRDRAAVHRRLADPLMGEERRQVIGVCAQVRQVHGGQVSRYRRRLAVGCGGSTPEDAAARVRSAGPWTAPLRTFGGHRAVDGGVSSTAGLARVSRPLLCGGRLAVMDVALPPLKSPTDVLAVVPYLLGFTPERSVVVMGMRERRVVFQARCDLPAAEDVAAVTEPLAAVVGRQAVDAALLVAYGPGAESGRTVDALRQAIESRGIDVLDALRADEGRYWSYLCSRPECCPPAGTPYDASATVVAASATYAGLSPAASRADLVARLAPADGVTRIAMRAASRRAAQRP